MGSAERSKKKAHGWKKAIVHFSMCFVIGFFTGFTPTSSTTSSSNEGLNSIHHIRPIKIRHVGPVPRASKATLVAQVPTISNIVGEVPLETSSSGLVSHRQLIVVTPTSGDDPLRGVLLRRLAGTIRLVPPPLTWIVVEKESSGSEEVSSEILRKTGIMYRHLVVKENLTESESSEMEHQRNVALRHIEHHRLVGIVHFAELSNVYDLDFFGELRQIEVFGTWPMAVLSEQRDKVIIEGPLCDSSQVIGWHLKKMNNEIYEKPPINISSFAFNSSILWDPERWGRPYSTDQGATQDSMKFVKEAVNEEDEGSVKGIAGEKCSRILLWHLFPFPTSKLSLLASDNPQTH